MNLLILLFVKVNVHVLMYMYLHVQYMYMYNDFPNILMMDMSPSGLNDCNDDGSAIVQREVVWKVPANYQKPVRITTGSDVSPSGRTIALPLEACCYLALTRDHLVVKSWGISVPLRQLVPDVLLTDLPDELKINYDEFQFNPKDAASCLGTGGAGGQN